jgi:hypothetical protein
LRMMPGHSAVSLLARMGCALLLALLSAGSRAAAQNPDTMMPDASAAKAKQILAQMIEAFGGPAYLNARESECAGRMSPIARGNDRTETIPFKVYWRYPDKNRTDIGKKGNVIDLFAGNDGWTLDHDGVTEEPPEKVDNFRIGLLNNPHYIFRHRLSEEGMSFRWAGLDLIDLKPVDWVELTDRRQRVYRIAVARETHLMVRFKVYTPAEANELPDEDVTFFSNYHPFDGIQTAMQISREHNSRRVSQLFYETCRYNSSLPADFFTRASLDQRFREVGSRSDKKKAAEARE